MDDDQSDLALSGRYPPDEVGALAHLYRGEVYRSTTWRLRLDTSTNWSVVTTGIALSLVYAEEAASPFPLLLVGVLVAVFLSLEARRYRYFNVWRARCRLMETDIFAPLLRGDGLSPDGEWNTLLANDYTRPHFHISYIRAIGRRLRKNYAAIFLVQAISYFGKIIIHPTSAVDLAEVLDRAAVGPIPGEWILFGGVIFHGTWIAIAVSTYLVEKRVRRRGSLIAVA
ncbi:MAG TPA: DUF2270 domain-containing protein [Paracoccaceae bacterium]|nr:DUF2270 domain-containing protein [Paracoccaceae bacterium]